jgi:uncharacterized protein
MADRVRRIDRACRLDFDATAPTPTAAAAHRVDDYLVVDAYLARDGLLQYSDGMRSWVEYRPAEELERAADSFASVPVTDDHPPDMVTPDNAREYMRGFTLSAVRTEVVDGVTYLRGTIKVVDAELIRALELGKRQTSIGMWSRVEARDGVYQGRAYSAVQTDCEGNHVAIVDTGRAGPAVRVFMDGAQIPIHDAEDPMRVTIPLDILAALKVRMDEVGAPTTQAKLIGPDGTEIEVPTWVAAMVEELKELKAAQAEATEEPAAEAPAEEPPPDETPAEDAEGELEPPPAEAKDDEDEEMTKDQIDQRVRRRVRLERLAAKADLDLDALDTAADADVARAFVAKVMPDHKVRADAAKGDVLDMLVAIAAEELAARPKTDSNPFERRISFDAKDDSLAEAQARAISKALGRKD